MLEAGKVQIESDTSGARIESYAIGGGRGDICICGAASHLIREGEEVIIMGYELSDKAPLPRVILMHDKSRRFEQR